MAKFNPDFWEVQADNVYLEGLPQSASLWFDTPEGQLRSQAFKEFYDSVWPCVEEMINTKLTQRQREVINLSFFMGKTQEDAAEILGVTQSTISRHLFGTKRDGKRFGGGIRKLTKLLEKNPPPEIIEALANLQQKLEQIEKHDALAV